MKLAFLLVLLKFIVELLVDNVMKIKAKHSTEENIKTIIEYCLKNLKNKQNL